MKKYTLLFIVTVLVLCMLTGCRGGNQATTPTTAAPTTQATTVPTTVPATQDTTPTTDNGNGPMMTDETQESTRQTNGTTMIPTEKNTK